MKNKALLFLNALWLFTIIYFCFGRYEWNIPSYFTLLLFVIVNFFALNMGYFSSKSVRRPISQEGDKHEQIKNFFCKYQRLFLVTCLLTIVFQIVWVVSFLGEFSVTNILQVLGENYYERMEVEFKEVNQFMQIRTLAWVVTYFPLPIGFMCFKYMPKRYKILFGITVFIEIFASLNMGVSKNIGDVVIIFVFTVFLKGTSSLNTNISSKERKKRRGMYYKIGAIIVVFLIIFSTVQSLRDDVGQASRNPFGVFAMVRENSFFDIFLGKNSTLTYALDRMGSYLSHGYAGLAYALELPFKSSYGLGFSNSLLEYANQYFGLPESINQATYNFRIQEVYGWKDGQWWSTAFVRIGNSVTFWFVPVVLFFCGRLFARAQRRWIEEKEVFSLVLCCQLFIGFVYLSCNLQIFQGRHILIGTICLLVLYFAKNVLRIRIRIRR